MIMIYTEVNDIQQRYVDHTGNQVLPILKVSVLFLLRGRVGRGDSV